MNEYLCPRTASPCYSSGCYHNSNGVTICSLGSYEFKVVHLVLPPEEKNMKTEPIAIFNPKNIAADDYFIKMSNALGEVEDEISRAKQLFPSMFINQHEAIAVIREEYLELEQECFKNQRNYNLAAQRKEAKQLAAMAIRLMIELT